MSKYIDTDLLKKEIKRLKDEYTDIAIDSQRGWVNANFVIDDLEQLLSQIDSLQQEQPEDLASLINEATDVAKRIIDRNSFYNSLPQNLQNKYTFEAWCEILKALSTIKTQEQQEIDLEKEFHRFIKKEKEREPDGSLPFYGDYGIYRIARHFYELGLKARKEENK